MLRRDGGAAVRLQWTNRVTVRCHICLVGEALCRNRELVERLAARNAVTLLDGLEPADVAIAGRAQAVAVDCGRPGVVQAAEWVRALRIATSGAIVVTDGGLRTEEVAQLLGAGARDYFSSPLDVAIVAERLEHLAATASRLSEHSWRAEP